jgi:hypothetical protein
MYVCMYVYIYIYGEGTNCIYICIYIYVIYVCPGLVHSPAPPGRAAHGERILGPREVYMICMIYGI